MRTLAVLIPLLLATAADAEDKCYYTDLADGTRRQVCYNLSKPSDAAKAQAFERSLTPRAGIFDGTAPMKEMLTGLHLQRPGGGKFILMGRIGSNFTAQGYEGGSPTDVQIAGVAVIPGQESAALQLLGWWVPPSSDIYVELPGTYARNGVRDGYFWLGQSLINVMLVERGVARPTGQEGPYLTELLLAQAFAKAQQLGAYRAP